MSRLFGTNGIRWLVETHGPEHAIGLAASAGVFFGQGSRVALGMDTRLSSPMFFDAAVSGLAASGCEAVCLGTVPTPLVQFAVRQLGLGGGLMVTASHNPPEFNGMKFFAPDGTEFSKRQEAEFEGIHEAEGRKPVSWDRVGAATRESQVQDAYRKAVISLSKLDRGINAAVDCANGTAAGYTPEILTAMGCNVTAMNSRQDGRFPGRLPEPLKENIGALMAAVKARGADFGVAHDGDADRAVFVDGDGSFVSGDKSLALFAVDALERRKGPVVVPINTSMAVQDAVEAAGGKVEYTAIGSPGIARRMMENGAVLGGEGNGGVIFPEHQFCRDGMMASARMAEIVSRKGPLSDLAAGLPEYHLRSDKLDIRPGTGDRILELVKAVATGRVSELDGVKWEADDHWCLVRLSGTEPIVRITVESREKARTDKLIKERTGQVDEIIRSLS